MEKGKKESCSCMDLKPGPCAWQVGMLTTRTDYTNNNEILSITISEQIFKAKFLKLLLVAKKI